MCGKWLGARGQSKDAFYWNVLATNAPIESFNVHCTRRALDESDDADGTSWPVRALAFAKRNATEQIGLEAEGKRFALRKIKTTFTALTIGSCGQSPLFGHEGI